MGTTSRALTRVSLATILCLFALIPSAATDDSEAALAHADTDPVAAMIAVGRAVSALDDPVAAAALADRIAPVCRRVAGSPAEITDGERIGIVDHVVAAGENPTAIAKRYRIGVGLIKRLNTGYAANALRIGQHLKVIDLAAEPLRIAVVASRYRLYAWRGEALIAALPCGLGKDASPTPRGETRIKLRVRDPEWRDPDSGAIIPPKDPRNILGGFWLGFDPTADATFKGIGIHGYTGEASERWIEKPGSHGCVRLLQDDIAWLFDLALEGTAISVRD